MTTTRIALLGGQPTLSRDAHRSWPIVTDDDRRAVLRVLDRGVLSGPAAPEATAFEEEFRELVQARHAVLTHSGTSALVLALAAAGVRAGDHVVVPAYSFVATALAVIHAGAIPIFADVNEETGLLDAEYAACALTSRTRAIMPVHVHGCPADLRPLQHLAERHRAVLVEDAAQAHGAIYEGTAVGAIGATGGFSLQSSKNLSAGEGGVFVTNDRSFAEIADRLRNFGQEAPLHAPGDYDSSRPLDGTRALESGRIGGMYRGNEMMAAFARSHPPTRSRGAHFGAPQVSRPTLRRARRARSPEGRISGSHDESSPGRRARRRSMADRRSSSAAGVSLPRRLR
jgi:dTDP-4-amino-4,6-dideoxygalactose transaminase